MAIAASIFLASSFFALLNDASLFAAIVYGLFVTILGRLSLAFTAPHATFLRVATVMVLLNYQSQLYAYIDGGFPDLVYVSQESILLAMCAVTGFTFVAFGGSNLMTARVLRAAKRPYRRITARHVLVAVLVTTVPAAFAFSYGTWTNYGVAQAADPTGGHFRPDLYYSTMLLVTLVATLEAYLDKELSLRPALAIVGTSLLLLFAFQMRRLSIGAVLYVAFRVLGAAPDALRTRHRLMIGASATATLILLFLGSTFWRHARNLGQGDGLLERATSAPTITLHELATTTREQATSRLVDLWSDAAAIQYHSQIEEADAPAAAWAQAAQAVPAALYPAKHTRPPWTCESSFARIGVHDDQGCPPTSEAILLDGFRGLALATLGWMLWMATGLLAWRLGGPLLRMATVPAWELILNIDNSVALPIAVGIRSGVTLAIVLGLPLAIWAVLRKRINTSAAQTSAPIQTPVET